MTKRPAFMFYPADWRKDPGLRVCSIAARGLWMDVLCLMHEAEPYGHLVVNGVAISDAQLARLVGESIATVRKLMSELEAHNVFSRTDAGVAFSRRMVADERVRAARAAGGNLGGNPTLLARPKANGKDRSKDNGKVNLRSNHRPTPSVAVAVAGSETATATASPPDAADSEREPVVTWLMPYDTAWQQQYGGPMPVEPNVQALRWMEGKHGAEETIRRWVIYLAATPARFAAAAKLKSGWNDYAAPPVTVSRGGTINTPAHAHAAVLWDRYKSANLLTRWARPEYERIGAELVTQGHYATVDAFLEELRQTRPWTLADARTDGYAINEIAARLAAPQQAAS